MLKKIYLAFSTFSMLNSGTKSDPVLILGDNDRDLIHHTFDIEGGILPGKSYLLELDVSDRELPLYFSHIRMGIRGSDKWHPEYFFIFGEKKEKNGGGLQPLGLDSFAPNELSTDEKEGRISMPINQSRLGGNYTRMKRILMLVQNDTKRHSGTKNKITLDIDLNNGDIYPFEFPAGKLENEGDVYLAIRWVNQTYTTREITSVKLKIDGDDAWKPKSMILLGLDERAGSSEVVFPIANIPNWEASGLGTLSTDPKEGSAEVLLYRAFL